MKKILFLIISASAIVLAGADFSLSNNKSGKFKFDAPSEKNAVLFFRARIKLPAPYEAWGANVLQVKLNGKALTSPINKDKNLVDSEVRPQISRRIQTGRFSMLRTAKYIATPGCSIRLTKLNYPMFFTALPLNWIS